MDSAARIQAVVDGFLRRHAAAALPGYLAAAEARGIPWRQAIAGQSFYQLGHGRKQRRLWQHFTPATSHIGTVIATHKYLTTTLYRANAVPVPKNHLVADADAAVRAARSLGLPVVVKPAQADFGTAVSVGLSSDADIRQAFEAARKHGQVLVEEQIPGRNYRLLVMHGQCVSAVRQTPAQVEGDGVHRIRELVERVNRTRSAGLSESWKKIPLDGETDRVLHQQGLGLEDVAPAGAIVRLRHQSNLSTGGTMENVTAEVHPDNRHLAVRAAAIAGLDVAGIDFITPDITRSYREAGGAICEINPTPGFVMGEAQGAIERGFIDGLFPPGDDGRVPTVVVLDGAVPDRLLGPIERLLALRSACVGVASADGLRVGPHKLAAGSAAADGATILLGDPAVDAALLALTSGDVVEHGLGFDRCSHALVLGGPPDRPARERRTLALHLLASVAAAVTIDAEDPDLAALLAAASATPIHVVDATPGRAPSVNGPIRAAIVYRLADGLGAPAIDIAGPDGAARQIALPATALGGDVEQRRALLFAVSVAVVLGLDDREISDHLSRLSAF